MKLFQIITESAFADFLIKRIVLLIILVHHAETTMFCISQNIFQEITGYINADFSNVQSFTLSMIYNILM